MLKTALSTILALIAFAGNSVLCRLALGENAIDATSFAGIRLLSGALVLYLILLIKNDGKKTETKSGSWKAGVMLFLYAITFSYAYISLDTGTGALILFGSVQLTMILVSIFKGNRLRMIEWLGVLTAFSGFVYLVLPGLNTPSFAAFLLMMLAGVAWGFYTLIGRGSQEPLQDTCYNFTCSLPFFIVVLLFSWNDLDLSTYGLILAVLSGAVTSGIGYAIWYSALGGLSSVQAAVVQLSVPILAGIGGVFFANELFSLRLAISSFIILGGILMVILGKHYFSSGKA